MNFERILDVYSPGMASPEPIKKPRKNISAPNVSAAGAALQAASKGSIKAIIKTAKAPVKNVMKKRIIDSDDEDNDKYSDGEPQAVLRTPKPVRQRAIKSYVQEESEDEISLNDSEYESD